VFFRLHAWTRMSVWPLHLHDAGASAQSTYSGPPTWGQIVLIRTALCRWCMAVLVQAHRQLCGYVYRWWIEWLPSCCLRLLVRGWKICRWQHWRPLFGCGSNALRQLGHLICICTHGCILCPSARKRCHPTVPVAALKAMLCREAGQGMTSPLCCPSIWTHSLHIQTHYVIL